MMSVWEECYTHFTLELLSPSGRFYYSNGGEKIEFWPVVKDKVFDGYNILGDRSDEFKNYFNKYQLHVYDELSSALFRGETSLCGGVDGQDTLEIIETICGER